MTEGTGVPANRAAVLARLSAVQARIADACIRSGRSVDEVRLVAVSKGIDVRHLRVVVESGHLVLGESYVQEWRKKALELSDTDVQWHMIGHLQTNKARYIAGAVSMVHSMDSLRLATALDSRGIAIDVLLEVNLADEDTKTGFVPDELRKVWVDITALRNVRVRGLMCLPPLAENPEDVRPWFRKLRALRDELAQSGNPLPELSMGMSHDFEIAIEEGATMVRVGTAIFGPRS